MIRTIEGSKKFPVETSVGLGSSMGSWPKAMATMAVMWVSGPVKIVFFFRESDFYFLICEINTLKILAIDMNGQINLSSKLTH